MITLFILEQLEDYKKPIVYAIPLEKQIEVEKIAYEVAVKWEKLYYRKSSVVDPSELFENLLDENEIQYEYIGRIKYGQQVDWIDEKISRVLI